MLVILYNCPLDIYIEHEKIFIARPINLGLLSIVIIYLYACCALLARMYRYSMLREKHKNYKVGTNKNAYNVPT